jgi:polyphosphate kinase 2 (PPK2 family)
MKTSRIVKLAREIVAPYCVEKGSEFRLGDVDPGDTGKLRYEDICAVERYLARNGVIVRKFFLHVSKMEQKNRFLERLDNPAKNWKFSPADAQA